MARGAFRPFLCGPEQTLIYGQFSRYAPLAVVFIFEEDNMLGRELEKCF